MEKLEDIDREIRGLCLETSRTLMGHFEDINGETSMILMGKLEAINGNFVTINGFFAAMNGKFRCH